MKTGQYVLRNSSIELLRIITMYLIVLNHFVIHGGFAFEAQTLSVARFWCYFLAMGGIMGVDVFVLISGYYLISDKRSFFNGKKILKLWGQIIFYSVSIYVTARLLDISGVDIHKLPETLFPITYGAWWFASTYFVLYLIHPFINVMLHSIDQAAYKKLLALLFTMWCLIPTITQKSFQGNNLLWFVTLYCAAGYIRLYGLFPKFSVKRWILLFVLSLVLKYSTAVIYILLGTKIPYFYDNSMYFYTKESAFTFACALSLFMIFKGLNIKYNKWINVIASATFGVYLIHDNRIVRPILWKKVFHNVTYQDSIKIIPYSIAMAAIVFIVCTLVELLRQRVFAAVFFRQKSDKI